MKRDEPEDGIQENLGFPLLKERKDSLALIPFSFMSCQRINLFSFKKESKMASII
jgi:hypothetical protein